MNRRDFFAERKPDIRRMINRASGIGQEGLCTSDSCRWMCSLFTVDDGSSPEQERYTPQTCKPYDCINNPAEQGTLSTKEPCDQIKLKNTDQAPVQTANNRKNQCQRVHNFTSDLTLDRFMFPNRERIIHLNKILIAKLGSLSYNIENT